ncbi:MAG: transporter substrate-binding domain-containing protein [Candidatus Methylacidiphilales bacterium]|nr:transporter substrate-binding domain-containing protein [Candidatus Methylacidiphilales bacterium]
MKALLPWRHARALRYGAAGLFLASSGFLLLLTAGPAKAHPLENTEAAPNGVVDPASRVIRASADPAWPPFSFRNGDGRLAGLDIDLFEEVARSAGLEVEWVPAEDWSTCLRMMAEGRVDVLTGTARSEEREKSLAFTRTYLAVPVAIVVRNNAPFLTALAQLKDERGAMPRDYITTNYLEKRGGSRQLVYTSTIEEALMKVARGDADFTMENLVTANHIIRSRGLTNLKIGGIDEFTFDLRLATRRDNPALSAHLDGALEKFPAIRKQEILAKWITVEGRNLIDWERYRWWAMGLVLAAVTVALVFVLRNRFLAEELAERRRIEAELQRAHDELAAANDQKNKLMAMAAHDLKNPLTSLMLTLENLRGLPPTEQDEEIRNAHQILNYMTSLVRNLLDIEAIDHGGLKYNPGKVSLEGLFQETAARLQPVAQAKNIRLECPPSAVENATVVGDRDGLRQILDNLVSNAIKFSPPGSRVAVGCRAEDAKRLRIEVADEGPGLTKEDQTRLFQRFTRLSARPTGGESSYGLGLSIVKRVAEAMGGRAGCDSQPGKGAVFYVSLPAA